MICGPNDHKLKDCLRAYSFTTHQTGGIAPVVQKGSKDNKSVTSPSAPRQATHTIGKQDARAPTKVYVMKVVEDKDAPDVITGNFKIFDTLVHALIDRDQPILMFTFLVLVWVVCRRVKLSMIS